MKERKRKFTAKDKSVSEIKTKLILLRSEGGSKVLSVTQFVPVDWIAVDVSVIDSTDNSVTLKLVKVK